ncbi:hypothetical protein [Sanyastnella coralliicola]|uniref:hypothetical protein n=1 Tax=Sanyastnella coralliicola TaxID=3069118 RepID=UPI0027B93D48|nr:hypothetical protein [Longitalea sp. SCSIO 12813]
MSRIAFFLSVILLGSGCTKNNFDGDLEPLVGRWKCVKTTVSSTTGEPGYPWYTSETNLGFEFEVEIHRRGRVCLFSDGNKLTCSRVKNIEQDENSIRFECPGLEDYVKMYSSTSRLWFDQFHHDSITTSGFNFIPVNSFGTEHADYTFVRVE